MKSARVRLALPVSIGTFAVPAAAVESDGMLSYGAMLQSLLALLIVLGVIVGAAWLLKRAQGRHGGPGSGVLRHVSAVAVGPRERVVIVEVADTWLVLGVAPGQVRSLHTLPKQTLPEETAASPRFADWLARARGEERRG